MEHPEKSKPKPLEITIDKWGATLKLITYSGGAAAVTTQAPRAGNQ
jgi:hypothetical protein